MAVHSESSATKLTGKRFLAIAAGFAIVTALVVVMARNNDGMRAMSRVMSPDSVGWAGIGWDGVSKIETATLAVPCALKLTEVAATGPADVAGLMPGDLVTSINGTTFQSVNEFQAATSAFRPEQTVSLGAIRNGTPLTVQIRLTDWDTIQKLKITAIGF